jgi:hypothetical protein
MGDRAPRYQMRPHPLYLLFPQIAHARARRRDGLSRSRILT